MAGFVYLDCPDCGFDVVLRDQSVPKMCPRCGADNERDVLLNRRPAEDDDRPEFFDARKPRE